MRENAGMCRRWTHSLQISSRWQ